jgi:hypothetical protein
MNVVSLPTESVSELLKGDYLGRDIRGEIHF